MKLLKFSQRACGVVFILCLLAASNLYTIGLGVYGGYNSSGASFSADAKDFPNISEEALKQGEEQSNSLINNIHSYIVGAYFNIGLPIPFVSLQTELFYARKGYLDEAGADTVTTINYFEIPLLLKVKLGLPVIPISVYALGGVSFAYSVDSEVKTVDSSGNTTGTPQTNPESLRKYDVTILFGGGLSFEFLAIFELFIEARYSIGFLNIIDLPNVNSSTTNRNIYVLLGFGIDI